MRVNLYLDVYNPALHPTLAEMPYYATENPQPKPVAGCKRFKITVDLPDAERLWAGGIDGTLPLDEKIKEVDE
jgi:hypothetical protein